MMAKENDDDVSWQRRYAQNAIITSEVVGGRGMVWGGREEGGLSGGRRARRKRCRRKVLGWRSAITGGVVSVKQEIIFIILV